MIILALEASTTSAKTMLFDTDTQQAYVTSRLFEISGDDITVRDGDSIYAQLMALGRQAAAGHRIDAIALSGTWHGLTLRNADLSARTPVMEWSYTGAQGLTAQLREDAQFMAWFYNRTGCMVNASYPIFKLRHLANQGVSFDGAIALDQPSLIFARLTGKRWTSDSLASGSGLLANHASTWDDEIFQRLGLPKVQLPELHSNTDSAPLTAEAAALLGVHAGIPVFVPGPDGGLSQVGDLATTPGDMTFSMGTSGALRFAVPQPSISPNYSTWSYRSPLGWLSGAATSGCGNCVDWSKAMYFGSGTSYAEIEQQLSNKRTHLPVFLPFLFGERSPGWQDQRRGGLFDLHPKHTRVDLHQAVLQGITFSLYHCFQELTAINGMPNRIVLSGGVLSSPFWTQFTVDTFGVPMQISTQQHSSIVGAMRMALAGSGLPMDQPGITESEATIVEPNLQQHAQLKHAFARYYEAYQRTKPDAVALL